MSNDNLYELSHDLAIINEELVEAGGELTDTLEARLDAVSLAIKDKIQSIGKWTVNLDGKADMIDKEIERLKHRKQITENLKERLKDYVHRSMITADIKKLEFPAFTVAIQKNPPSVGYMYEDRSNVPDAYKTVKQVVTIDGKRILDDLKAGQKVEGCTLIIDKTHLRIR